jgi:hypothetical protein
MEKGFCRPGITIKKVSELTHDVFKNIVLMERRGQKKDLSLIK